MNVLDRTGPWFVAPRYCEHGKLCDDQCDDCDEMERQEAADAATDAPKA